MDAKIGADPDPGGIQSKFTIKMKGWAYTVLPLPLLNFLIWWEAGRTQGTDR